MPAARPSLSRLESDAPIDLTRCTVSGNSADGGGGICARASLSLTQSVLAGNSATQTTSPDLLLTGTVSTVSAYNLLGSLAFEVGDFGPGSFADDSPLLSALGDYGGPVRTLALLPGSAALDAGNPNVSSSVDARGVGVVAGRSDIGAFESRGFTLSAEGGGDQTAAPGAAFSRPLRVRVTASDPLEPTDGGRVTFVAPDDGSVASVEFLTATIGNGIASSGVVTAGTREGPFRMAASTRAGVTPVQFALTNAVPPPTPPAPSPPPPEAPEPAPEIPPQGSAGETVAPSPPSSAQPSPVPVPILLPVVLPVTAPAVVASSLRTFAADPSRVPGATPVADEILSNSPAPPRSAESTNAPAKRATMAMSAAAPDRAEGSPATRAPSVDRAAGEGPSGERGSGRAGTPGASMASGRTFGLIALPGAKSAERSLGPLFDCEDSVGLLERLREANAGDPGSASGQFRLVSRPVEDVPMPTDADRTEPAEVFEIEPIAVGPVSEPTVVSAPDRAERGSNAVWAVLVLMAIPGVPAYRWLRGRPRRPV